MTRTWQEPPSLTVPGLLLGIGLGGFVDGIVLHQILQWHHMLTSEGSYPASTVAGLETNTLWDGLFHLASWIATTVGLWLLWKRLRLDAVWSGRQLFGLMLAGWGLFNLVEGVIDHHILGIHHVKAGSGQTLLDLAFLALGAVLLTVGILTTRAGAQSTGALSPRRVLVACRTLTLQASRRPVYLPSVGLVWRFYLGSSKSLLLFDAFVGRDQRMRVLGRRDGQADSRERRHPARAARGARMKTSTSMSGSTPLALRNTSTIRPV